jgi:hypothetical protein
LQSCSVKFFIFTFNNFYCKFGDTDFIATLLADLTKLRYHIRKVLHPVKIIDGFELICGSNYTREKVEHAISTGWSLDPVHLSKHVYAKTALHLLEKIAPVPEKAPTSANLAAHPPGRKRTWSDSKRSDGGATSGSQRYGGSSGGGYGGGGGLLRRWGISYPEKPDMEGAQGQQLAWRRRRSAVLRSPVKDE